MSRFWTLQGLFELTHRALQGPSTCYLNSRKTKTLCSIRRCITKPAETRDANLDCFFVLKKLCFKIGGRVSGPLLDPPCLTSLVLLYKVVYM